MNSPELLKKTIQAVYAKGSALEYEVVEASSLHRLLRYADEGLFDRGRDNIWLLHGGGFGATPPIARNVLFNIDEGLRLFPNAIWGVTATGRDMFRIVRWAFRSDATSCVLAWRIVFICQTAAWPGTIPKWCGRRSRLLPFTGSGLQLSRKPARDFESRCPASSLQTADIYADDRFDRRQFVIAGVVAGGMTRMALSQEKNSGARKVASALALARIVNSPIRYSTLPRTPIMYSKMVLASTLCGAAAGREIGSVSIIREIAKQQGGKAEAALWLTERSCL